MTFTVNGRHLLADAGTSLVVYTEGDGFTDGRYYEVSPQGVCHNLCL